MKKRLTGLTLGDLKEVVKAMGMPSFTALQIADWLYKKRVHSIDQMTNLSKSGREALSQEYEVGRFDYVDVQISKDGTKKYLFPVQDGEFVETVMIPDDERYTICVSSQVGCKMGCHFCMTGKQGFLANLSSPDIINQFLSIDEAQMLTNAVFMGMGEPLDNYDQTIKTIEILTSDWGFGWSPRRITLSTIGITPALKKFLEQNNAHLAVSLHNPFDNERLELMPVQKAYPLSEVISLIRQYDFTGQRRVSFEYIMLEGVNDSKRHADALIRLLRGLECRVNLIRFHTIDGSGFKSSSMPVIEAFKERLNNQGIFTTIRASRGEDIAAACGTLYIGRKS